MSEITEYLERSLNLYQEHFKIYQCYKSTKIEEIFVDVELSDWVGNYRPDEELNFIVLGPPMSIKNGYSWFCGLKIYCIEMNMEGFILIYPHFTKDFLEKLYIKIQ